MERRIFISFDVDGTMVKFDKCVTTHLLAFQEAISRLFAPCEQPDILLNHSIDGWMDKAIIRAMIEKLGFEASEENINKAMDLTEEIFLEKFNEYPTVPPGMKKVLEACSQMENVTIGVASGNLPQIAWKKLSNAGLIEFFPKRIAGFGRYVFQRKDALILARENAQKAVNHPFDVAIHVGDTPMDVEAAQLAGAIAVAVRTGDNPNQVYKQPCHVFDNLESGYQEFMALLK